jgi:hypothetical protein
LQPDTIRYNFTDSTADTGAQSSARIVLLSEDEQLRSLVCGLLVAHGYVGAVALPFSMAVAAELVECDVAIVEVATSHADTLRILQKLKVATRAGLVAIFSKTNPLAPERAAVGDVLVG